MNKKIPFFLVSGLFVLSGLYLRYLNLSIPLSYDEGYWAYITTLILKGRVIYKDVYSSNPLLIYFPYLISEKIFGWGWQNLRFTGIIWNLITVYFICFLTKKTFGWKTGVIALCISLIYTISFQHEGLFLLQAEQISQLPLFISLYLLFLGLTGQKLKMFLFSGLLMGISWNIREHYLILNVLLIVYLFFGVKFKKIGSSHFKSYILGSIIPFIGILLYLLTIHQLKNYLDEVYFHRFLYMFEASKFSLTIQFFIYLYSKLIIILPLFIFSLISFISFRKFKNRFLFLWIYLLFLANLLAFISTGSRLFNHYFLYLTYGMVIPSAIGAEKLLEKTARISKLSVFILVMFLIFIVFKQYEYNFRYLREFNRPIFGKGILLKNLIINYELIDFLNQKAKSSRILFLGESLPNYYYLNRDMNERLPSSFGFTFSFAQRILWKEWFDDFKKNPAVYIVEDYGMPDTLVIKEFRDYVNQNYVFDRKINQDYVYVHKSRYI